MAGLAIVGWYFHLPLFVQFSPSFAPMQFNTALSFLSLGFGLLAMAPGKKYLVFLSTLGPIAFGIATNIQYIFNVSLGIDEIFFNPYITTNTPYPGRMGPNTALCLVFLSTVFLLTLPKKKYARRLIFQDGILSFVFSIAFSSLVYNFTGISSSFGLSDVTQMSIPSSISIMALGYGTYVLQRTTTQLTKNDKLLPPITYAVLCIGFTVSFCLWQAANQREQARIQAVVQTIAQSSIRQIEVKFKTRFQALSAMAYRLAYAENNEKATWERDAKLYLEYFPDIRSVAFVDKDYTVRWIYPLEGNEKSIGKNLSNELIRKKTLELAAESRSVAVTPPLTLYRGGTGVVAFFPVVHASSENFKGVIASSFRLSEVFSSLTEHFKPGKLALEVIGDNTTLYSTLTNEKAIDVRYTEQLELSLFGQSWTLKLTPLKAFINEQSSPLPLLIFCVAISISILVSSLVHMIHIAKRKMQEVNLANTKFKALFEGAPDGIVIVNEKGVIERVNAGTEKMFGYSREELVGNKVEILVPPKFSTMHVEQRSAFFKNPSVRPMGLGKSLSGRRKDGSEFPIEISLSPLKTPEGILVTSSIRDITDRVMAQKLLREQEAKFAAAAKMAALGEMASGIGHEINNPLAIIRGTAEDMSDRMAQGLVGPEYVKAKLTLIERTSVRIERIIKALRAFAREEGLEPPRSTSLAQIVEDTMALCGERFKSNNINLKVDPIPTSIQIVCRPIQISQVLLNILNNAFDAVSTLEEKWVKLEVKDKGIEVLITVTDSGTGIPQKIRSRIMQPFFSTKEPGQGSGLGLSISKGILESHLGSLILNEECPNTQFIIKLFKSPTMKKEIKSSFEISVSP